MAILLDPEQTKIMRATPRLLQILRILAKHGFLGALFGRGHWPTPQQVRETFEELGLVFLKFGQVLALRPDLLPPAYTKELALLHDALPAMPFSVVRATVEIELQAPLMETFSAFGETPLAAATIAQVHEATLKDGRHVAVKVQRPGLKAVIDTDVAALKYLVALGQGIFPRLRPLDLPVLVSDMADSLTRETDFGREARSMSLIRAALADVPDLWIPNVVTECSGATVLTMEYSAGERVDLYAKLHPDEMPHVIDTLVKLTLHSIFEEGLFHADPHPGNVFVLPDGRLSLLDFGNTGDLDEPMRESLTHLLEAVVTGDARGATDAYLEMAPATEKVNHAALLVDIKAVLYEIRRSDLEKVSVGAALEALLRAGTRNGVHNPAEFVQLSRAFVILESMVVQLAPDYNHMKSFKDEISRLTARHFSAGQIKEKTTKLAREMERLMLEAPADTRRILRRFAEGDLGRLPGLEALGRRISRNLDRLTGSMAYASLVIGGSMLLMTNMGGWVPRLGGAMIAFGLFGIVIARIRALRRDPDQR